jgi:HEAT repeat protein
MPMRSIPIALSCCLLLPLPAATSAAEPADPTSRDILDAYLAGPCPEKLLDPGRSDRLAQLHVLQDRADAGVAAIAAVLPHVECPVHRLELLEVLGRIPMRASSDLLLADLHDPDVTVRRQALRSLRRQASRILRAGVVDVPEEPQFPPQVEGLVPYLLEAATDQDPAQRSLALWSLADTREPQAQTALRAALDDPDGRVRFLAACLLSEFGDDTGLPLLREALDKLVAGDAAVEPGERDHLGYPTRYMAAQHLLASFQRLTGESLGDLPAVPMVLSSLAGAEESARAYDELLIAWQQWWKQSDAED